MRLLANYDLSLDLIEELAEPLAECLVEGYVWQNWQDSPVVETMARVAAMLEKDGREVPPCLLEVLKKASEAGHSVGLA